MGLDDVEHGQVTPSRDDDLESVGWNRMPLWRPQGGERDSHLVGWNTSGDHYDVEPDGLRVKPRRFQERLDAQAPWNDLESSVARDVGNSRGSAEGASDNDGGQCASENAYSRGTVAR
jgi:hypothetical protein